MEEHRKKDLYHSQKLWKSPERCLLTCISVLSKQGNIRPRCETLAFEMQIQSVKVPRHLKVQLAPMDEWIRTPDIDPNDYATGQLIVNNPRYQNVDCCVCRRRGHLKRNCRQGVPRESSRRPQLSRICRQCSKGRLWANEGRSARDN